MCKDNYDYKMFSNATMAIWENKDLYSNYRMLKFSGDKDGCVPTIGTLGWINSMNRDVKEDWRAWYLDGTATLAGYTQAWEGVTLATVHGAGHMVPQDQRQAALEMMHAWITEKEFPKRTDPAPPSEEVVIETEL